MVNTIKSIDDAVGTLDSQRYRFEIPEQHRAKDKPVMVPLGKSQEEETSEVKVLLMVPRGAQYLGFSQSDVKTVRLFYYDERRTRITKGKSPDQSFYNIINDEELAGRLSEQGFTALP